MSSHPGSTLNDALELALYLKKNGIRPEQVQDFYPTPGTISTVMYYTGFDPMTGKSVYCTNDYHEKALQRALLQYNRPENYELVKEAIIKCGRPDLIGFSKDCLIAPRKISGSHSTSKLSKFGTNTYTKVENSKNIQKKAINKKTIRKNGSKK
jgi:hypothetical protein